MSKILSNIRNSIEIKILNGIGRNNLIRAYYDRNSKVGYSHQQKHDALLLQEKDLDNYIMSVAQATDPDNPRRGDLMRFFQNMMLHDHLRSCLETRILKVQRSKFRIVDEKGNENEDLRKLLQRKWHEDLINHVVGYRFNGTTLIEIFDLNDKGELAQVSKIPQSHFLPAKGLMLEKEYDNDGWDYKNGALSNYYLQVGNDYELGMMMFLAPTVMAGKLGLGSWLDYIDKFGVPPIFATTERLDSQRRDELFDMLSDFRSNHFAVLQGQEKIDIPSNYNVDASNTFDKLLDRCDKNISKSVLGGIALTDEKSFVGSAEIQYEVAKDRHEADKLLYMYIFNERIRFMLSKISPVYADFATHSLEWDDSEGLTLQGYITAVAQLAPFFEIDTKEVERRTGIPLVGRRNTPVETSQVSASAEGYLQKKKNRP